MANFNASKLVVGDQSSLETVSLKQLLQATNAYGVFGAETEKGTRLVLAGKDGKRLTINGKNSSTINIHKKAVLPATGDLFDDNNEPWLKELFNNNVIYYGESTIKETIDGKEIERTQSWLTLSKPGGFKRASKVVTVESLMASVVGAD